MKPERATLATVDPTTVDPVGSWMKWTPERAAKRTDLVEAVERFEPVDHPAGHEAAKWLREEALDNDPSTKTYLLFEGRDIQGFFACCSCEVRLSEQDAVGLRVPHYSRLPAFLVAWVARSCHSEAPGLHLMLTAYGLARSLAEDMGMVALALDPMDEAVAKVWEAEPYSFQRCIETGGKRPPRLWLPIG